MKRDVWIFALGLIIFLWSPLYGQQADAPSYRDGDWWRVKVEVKRPTGVTVGGPQLGGFPEYLVRIEGGVRKVFGIKGEHQKEIKSPEILSVVLGSSEWRGELLRFPLRLDLSWSSQFRFHLPGLPERWEQGQYQVQSWEKVKTPKGEFEAFKITMNVAPGKKGPKAAPSPPRITTYYYSPKVKAILYFHEDAREALTTSTLVDFTATE